MDIKSCKSCRTCESRWKNFDNLTDEQIREIDANRQHAKYKAGEIIFKQGTPTDNAVFMLSGLAKMYMETPDDKNVIVAMIKPGRLIGGPGIFLDNVHHLSLAAVKDTVACFIDMDLLKKMVHLNGDFAEGFLSDISFKGLEALRKIITISQKKMNGRLAEGLMYLSDNVFQSNEFDCCLSRQEIGELTQMTKESVVRLLKELHREDIIHVQGSKIKILDKTRLQKIKDSG